MSRKLFAKFFTELLDKRESTQEYQQNLLARVFGYNAGTLAEDSVGAGVTVEEEGFDDIVQKTVFTFVNTPVVLADEAGVVAYGARRLYDFPVANEILILAASADLVLTKSSAGVNANWDGDFGVGSDPADNDAALSAAEQNIIPTTATPQASAGATTAVGRSTASAFLLGSESVRLYINFLVDDADHNVGGTACNLILNGTMVVLWANVG